MSRLLDHLKNAERKRRDLQARHSETVNSTADSPEQANPEAPAAAAAPINNGDKARLERKALVQIKRSEETERKLREAAELAANQAAAARENAEARALQAANAAMAAMERERNKADARAAIERRIEDSARARFKSEQRLAETEKEKLHAEEEALRSASERARLEAETASIARQRRADAARRAQTAGERRQLGLARLGASFRRFSLPSALVVVAFVSGFGVSALWLKPTIRNGEELSRGPAAVQTESRSVRPPAEGALLLKLDADYAGFAVRAASKGGKPR